MYFLILGDFLEALLKMFKLDFTKNCKRYFDFFFLNCGCILECIFFNSSRFLGFFWEMGIFQRLRGFLEGFKRELLKNFFEDLKMNSFKNSRKLGGT